MRRATTMVTPVVGRGGLVSIVVCLLALGVSLATRLAFVPRAARPNAHGRAALPPDTIAGAGTAAPAALEPRARIGQKIFFDPNLSVPAGTSCASCHDPEHGYSGTNGSPIGVPRGSRPGHFARRSTPSVLYLRFVRRFHLVWDDESDHPEAYGGFFWDGRSDSLAALAEQPLLNPNEMANRDIRQIAEVLRTSAYAADLQSEFDDAFSTPQKTMEALGLCLEAFLTSRAMSPFSSKYDDYVRGRATLTPLEARGLAAFQDSEKGACSGCHRMDPRSALPESSMFTDYGYDTVAIPRNRALPPNRDARRFDLGVCERRDPKRHTEDDWFCGSFRTPSLRNVATRTSFMHNGAFRTVRDVVTFYATRGTNPDRWYSGGAFDDLPEKYRQYVNVTTPPYNRAKGDPPALDDADIDAVVAFLGALTDREYPRAP